MSNVYDQSKLEKYLKLFPRKLQLNQFMTINKKYTYPKFKISVSKMLQETRKLCHNP